MYNNLKQLINTYITSNGQGEITGAKLNEVLNEIVRQFGQYQIFGGVINPGSMAPINDTNVFFFAAQPGNYSDFGFVLPAFKMGFVSKDAQGNWQLDSFDIGSLDYEDLLNLPQVNGVTLQGDKSAADLGLATSEQGAKADTAYQKPGTGIPLADLDSSVQDTLSQNTTDIEELKAAYEGLTMSNIVVVDDHTAVADPQPNTIYREQGVSSYSDWMYYDGSWYKMAEYNNAIDDVPTPHSNNLVKSGGVYTEISRLDQKVTKSLNNVIYESEHIWSVEKPAGAGVNYPFALSPGIPIVVSVTGVNSADTVNVLVFDENGTQRPGIAADKTDIEVVYNNSYGIGYFRITGNVNSAVTISVKEVVSKQDLKESVDELEEDVDKINADIYITDCFDGTIQNGTNANHQLLSNLRNKKEYLLTISGSGNRGNWGIKPLYDNNVDHGIPFTIGGVSISDYARGLANGNYILSFDNIAPYNVASYIRVVDLGANVTIKITSELSDDIRNTIKNDVAEAILAYNDEIVNQNTDTVDTVMIPQRESSGGSDFPLTKPLKAGYSYKLVKTCSGTGYNNFAFKNAGGNIIPFYIDGLYRTTYVQVDDGEHDLILTDEAVTVRSTDNTTTSVSLVIKNDYLGLNKINEDIIGKLYPIYNNKETYDYLVNQANTQGICIEDYINSINAYRLIASNNGISMANALNNGIITSLLYENTVHDSQIVVKNGICYVVYAANTAISDNAGSPTSKVILSKFDLSDVSTRVDIIVAENGEHGLTGGAGQPNIVADVSDSDKLHIIFTANVAGYTIMTCDYSILSGSCSNYREVVIYNKAGSTGNARNADINTLFNKTFNTGTSDYYSQQCNSTISYYNGYYYIGMVMAGGSQMSINLAVVFKTQDFTNWTYFADHDRFNVPSHCELAIGVDSNGMIYSASRRLSAASVSMGQYGANYGVIAKWNASSGNLIERSFYRNCGSRPSFFRNGDDLYLFSNNWYRSICDIIMIDARQLNASQLFAQFKKSAYHYVSFAIDGDKVVCSSSSNGIEISKFTWPTSMTDTQAFAKIAELLS